MGYLSQSLYLCLNSKVNFVHLFTSKQSLKCIDLVIDCHLASHAVEKWSELYSKTKHTVNIPHVVCGGHTLNNNIHGDEDMLTLN